MKIKLYADGILVREIDDLKSIYVGDFAFTFIKRNGTEIIEGTALDLYDTYLIEED